MRRHFRLILAIYIACFVFTMVHVLPSNLIGRARSKDADPKEIKITNIERLNTSADEDDPCLAPSGLAFFFTSNAEGHADLMMAVRKAKDAPFINAKPIEELCGKSDDISPFPLAKDKDGWEYLFFASKRDAGNFDVFFTNRPKPTDPFNRIALAPVHQVCTPEDEAHPWVSPDSKEMYFSRRTKDGWRLGHARGSEARSFEKVELLDFPPGFCHAVLTRDGLTMYLQGPVEDKKLGLFQCKRSSKSAKWGQPQPLTGLNCKDSVKGECSPSLSADGFFLYFASDRPGGKGGLDLYFMSTSEMRKMGL
jgi:hypothetical protein